MGSLKNYFVDFGKGLWSLLVGMKVTGREFVTPKVTEQYPENRATLKIADRFRATLTLQYDEEGNHRCIACGICQMNCPNHTIEVISKKIETEEGKSKRVLDDYIYNLGSCVFCQLCVNSCPHNALAFTNAFEQAVFDRRQLVKHLNRKPKTSK
ncbi:MAG: NADH-quinone oxidoreductase subunit I [Porphyromonadaceae bacterium]|nr:NADH-quinone oxidoreductase subunit I [Porphyromonadaceae bacterium]